MAIDADKLDALIGRFVTDFGAATHAATVVIGDKLGLYRELAERGPITGAALADELGFDRRLVEEWLAAQFVGGSAEYDPATAQFSLTEEQAAVLADDSTPAYPVGAQTITAALWKDEERIRNAFLTGRGLGWHEHNHDLFHGTEKLFKPGYLVHLVSAWIPALDGVDARVARWRCTHCRHRLWSRRVDHSACRGVPDRRHRRLRLPRGVRRRGAQACRGSGRCRPRAVRGRVRAGLQREWLRPRVHLRRPARRGGSVGGARHIREALAADGTWLLVEPGAMAPLEANVSPVSRIFYAGSVGICTPAAEAQRGGYALGNPVPDDRWAALLSDAGFSRFRRATETPFNRVFEVRL